MRSKRTTVGFALVFVTMTAAGVLALGAALSTAATPPPTLTLNVAPQPAVATSENILGILKLSYPANASPTTLAGTFVQVTITPALSSSAEFDSDLSSSFCSLRSLSLVRCDLGNVRKGQSRTMFVVVSASGTTPTLAGAAFWNESQNGKNPQPNNTVSSTPPSAFTTVVAGTGNANGKCTVGGSNVGTSTALGAGNQVGTHVNYPTNAQGFPCTPASVQDDIQITVTEVTCTASPCLGSQVNLPLLTSPATVTLTFDGSLFPPPGSPPNPNTFVLYEKVGAAAPEAVPLCSTEETTSFGTCKLDAVKFGTRGIQVTLSVMPASAVDPDYWG